MMSKGTRREREAVQAYQSAGYATYRPATVQYGENDMFGLFDVLALHPDGGAVHAVQVKSNRANGIRKWRRHTRLFRSFGWRTSYLVPCDNEGWRWIECCNDKNREVYDGRESDAPMGEGLTEALRPA